MSAFVKSKLKAAREAISRKDFKSAKDAASNALEYEPENYNANVFLGLALFELDEREQSEQAYRRAIDASPDHPLAWQGISRLYEKTQDQTKYSTSLDRLMTIHAQAGDAVKCAEVLQKFIGFYRTRGSRIQLAEALNLLLPNSKLYTTLSGLPPLDPTNPESSTVSEIQRAIQDSLPVLDEIVRLHEAEETETIKREFEKRRLRLGASGPEQLKKEVGREVWGASPLPSLYEEILNHPNTSDEHRRQIESRLLRRRQEYLFTLPTSGELSSQKGLIASQLREQVDGMVLLGIPDELAWNIYIESADVHSIEDYDTKTLQKYLELFPNASLGSLLKGYFGYQGVSILGCEEDSTGQSHSIPEDNYPDMMIDAFNELPHSVIAHRIVADLYEQEADPESAIKAAESGLELVRRHQKDYGSLLTNTSMALNVTLACSLVHYFPPKHHARALGIINDVLNDDPDNIRCLMGRAYILQASLKWNDSSAVFARVAELIPEDLNDGIRAKEEYGWCISQAGDPERGSNTLRSVLETLDQLEEREPDQARCWWRLGQAYWKMGASSREEAYQYFITALKRSNTFAPAFTSLGIYYAEFTSPPDPKRASKCFQKAFELDPREAEAARRLAEGFAEEREWDLVEVVSRRTIEGEGGPGGGSDAARYLPLNAWAWKAIGVVELVRRLVYLFRDATEITLKNRQRYPEAIEALQIALRTEVDDQLSWLRLGEAYLKAGRYAAAIKALTRAQELDPEDWICSYFIGEVQRQVGQLTDAIRVFEGILVAKPAELRVLMSLSQTYLDLGCRELATAFTTRAEDSFTTGIRVALRLLDASPGFRHIVWKLIGDALFHLSQLQVFSDERRVVTTLHEVVLHFQQVSERLSGIITIQSLQDTSTDRLSLTTLEACIASFDLRLSLAATESTEDTVSASSYYDLSTALGVYARRPSANEEKERIEGTAIQCVKEAISLDYTNDTYWNVLGSLLSVSKPKSAQHAFIKALEIDSKNVVTWTNLGLFYLYHQDVDLANEALYKAQVLNPDFALAWVGQGLVAAANGHEPEARALFEHAVNLPSPVLDGDVLFAKRLFTGASDRGRNTADTLYPAFFVLDRYCKQRPQDASALHLFALVCEAIGQAELAIGSIQSAIAILEAAYEESEDPVIERQYTIAHLNLARLNVSIEDYEAALESFQLALGLLPEQTDDPSTLALLSQAQLGSGLAHFKLGALDEALEQLQAAMTTSADNPVIRGHVVVILAQTLWAIGSEDGRESAKAQLLESIETDPENLLAINTLAGMGILTEDDSLIDAALSEVLALPLEERRVRDPQGEVTYLLAQHSLAQGDVKQALSVVQKVVSLEPSDLQGRTQLATLTFQQRQSNATQALLANSIVDPDLGQSRDSLSLRSIALAHQSQQGDAALRLVQKAVMLTPWKNSNWESLAYVRSRLS